MSTTRTPQQSLLFDPRFLESYAGQALLTDPRTAIAELLANAWDAGATLVNIKWPDDAASGVFSVEDNGGGMTEEQFLLRWRTLSYDRVSHQGKYAEFPVDVPEELAKNRRRTFGCNGIGRFAAFCFGDAYTITSRREGSAVTCKVKRGTETPLSLSSVRRRATADHGTSIVVDPPVRLHGIGAEQLRTEIGLRFLSDPAFHVLVNGRRVSFEDIPSEHSKQFEIDVPELGSISVLVFDTQTSDRTVKHHGIAWHVNGRLVGECSWRSFTDQTFIDGRKAAARRFTFIVRADALVDHVSKDWTAFNDDEAFRAARERVSERIRQFLLDATVEQREEVFSAVRDSVSPTLKNLGPIAKRKWEVFVRTALEQCPSLSERDLKQLGGVLANLELASSKFGLIAKLHDLKPHELDQLHQLLEDWTLDMAKVVLDELRSRLRLVDELRKRAFDENAYEVQELQPIFARGLWIFGPEYETIEFTSNERMTTVIQRIFGQQRSGSRLRPDFVVLPDGSVGLYSYPLFDDGDQGEIGVAKLVIVELKRAGVTVGAEEKDQCWKYVKELDREGLLLGRTRVTCFLLGSKIDPQEVEKTTHKANAVEIVPMPYNVVLDRAKSRLLKLYDRVREAPFLQRQGGVDAFGSDREQGQLSF